MIPFSPPKVDQRVIDEVIDALNSGLDNDWKNKDLGIKVADYVNSPAVLCVNSCTSGLFLMLKWFGIQRMRLYPPIHMLLGKCNITLWGKRMVDVKEDFTIDPNEVAQRMILKRKRL